MRYRRVKDLDGIYGHAVQRTMRIDGFKHKGLRRLYEHDDASRLPATAARKINRILAARRMHAMGMKNPPHPGEVVRKDVIRSLGLSVTTAATLLGVRRATLSDVIHGKAALSAEMALRLEKAFGVSMDLLLKMQAGYDAAQARRKFREIKVARYVAPEGLADQGDAFLPGRVGR